MASQRLLARLDALIWTLIFGGLFLVILGIATHGEAVIAGWSLGVIGGIAVTTGAVLIHVRSRLPEPQPGGAQSRKPSPEKKP